MKYVLVHIGEDHNRELCNEYEVYETYDAMAAAVVEFYRHSDGEVGSIAECTVLTIDDDQAIDISEYRDRGLALSAERMAYRAKVREEQERAHYERLHAKFGPK